MILKPNYMIELPKTHWLRFRRTRNQVAPHLLMRKQKHNQTKRYNVTKKKKLFVCKSKIVIEKQKVVKIKGERCLIAPCVQGGWNTDRELRTGSVWPESPAPSVSAPSRRNPPSSDDEPDGSLDNTFKLTSLQVTIYLGYIV